MQISDRYLSVRKDTHRLHVPLTNEDMVLQTMPDVSPMRWHLAHTTWFFDTFVLGGRTRQEGWDYLFNSYYNGAGPQFPRDKRGTQSRPDVHTILSWRETVDEAVLEALTNPKNHAIVEVGTHHEQQHQELMITDIKHVLFSNPLAPAYTSTPLPTPNPIAPSWTSFDAEIAEIGHSGQGFSFDNEAPQHRAFLESFEIADRPVSNGEFLSFIEDGGYMRTSLWFAEAWDTITRDGWTHPLYWRDNEGAWEEWSLNGWIPLDPMRPASHISLYEADAFAHWAGARLPTEFEWERALGSHVWPQPRRMHTGATTNQFGVGDVWEWTSSAYSPYPGFKPWEGTLGEYNGKFMLNQYVLRGGSYATPHHHIRATYRNFFPARARWQATGFRLARSVS